MSDALPIQMLPRPRGKATYYTRREGEYFNVLVALPAEMVDRLDLVAKASFRSRTAEIHQRLLASLQNESVDEHGVIVLHVSQHSK